jgi:hypothetical protein
MISRKLLLAAPAALGFCLFSTVAFAQGARPAAPTNGGSATTRPAETTTTTTTDYTEHRTEGSNVVIFKEDLVGAGNQNPLGDTVRPPPGAVRVGLLRPRYNFVSEMLKSVENL